MRLERISSFRLVTQAPDRLLRFYEALGFAIGKDEAIGAAELALLGIGGTGWRHAMTLGGTRVDLDCFSEEGHPYPAEADAASRCFQHLALVTDDVHRAWTAARAAGAGAISRDSPVTLPDSAGGVTAVKFRDPEGHPLELIAFPDATDRGWSGEGVIGIDHSAMVATDLGASKAFYEALGLSEGKRTLNHGPTQAALDSVDDPRVDVVPMRPVGRPPHVELLHYRQPADALGASWRANDVAATRIVWQGAAPALLRDPDGHLHQVATG